MLNAILSSPVGTLACLLGAAATACSIGLAVLLQRAEPYELTVENLGKRAAAR